MIKIKSKGNFKNTERVINNVLKKKYVTQLESLAREGVRALSDATPVDTGKTAASWDYKILITRNKIKIVWINNNLNNHGTPIAILIQLGHATSSGSYVQGRDYINPAMRPIFDEIAQKAWREVTK